MIKKYNQYIKENIDHSDIDPWGEEDWEADELSPVLQKAREQGKPFDQITRLNCYRMNLENLDGIEQLVNLEILSCSYNQLTNLRGIENLNNLKILSCHNNQLTSLREIENLRNLEELDCSHNQLTSLEGIENLRNLRLLYCSHNNFSSEYNEYLKKWREEKYKQYIKENIKNIKTDLNDLLKTIGAQKVLMGDEFNFNSENYNNIEDVFSDAQFIKSINKNGLKRGNIEYSQDCETFMIRPSEIKFFLIFNEYDSELEPNPKFIVIQTRFNNYKWSSINMYKVNNNIKNFYDKLSSKTIEIKKGDKNYIYKTSNAGNDWILQNVQNKNDEFKTIMSDDDIYRIKSKNIDIID
jgi:Leucine-rich repeat (LRR) protein